MNEELKTLLRSEAARAKSRADALSNAVSWVQYGPTKLSSLYEDARAEQVYLEVALRRAEDEG